MSQRPDDDSADPDPLLWFANEPSSVAAPTPPQEIPKETEPVQTSGELDALRERAETAERSLRDARREAAALKRQVATLVSAARDNGVRARRSVVALGVGATCLLALATIGWRVIPAATPPIIAAAEPASEPAAQPPPAEVPQPIAEVRAPAPEPQPAVAARATEPEIPEPRAPYVGTLSVDAVPAGGEVFINRKSVGRTPVRLTGLRAGSHLVWIEREGYRRFTRVVLVPANKVSRVSVALEPEVAPTGRR